MSTRAGRITSALTAMVFAASLFAQDAPLRIGRETKLPIPRYISINTAKAYMRRGPSTDYPIEWVYQRENLPVRIIGESGHWRKVEDYDGVQGWFHYALLSGNRTVVVTADRVALNEEPGQGQAVTAILENGVIADLEICIADWCQVSYEQYEGWIPKAAVWGVDAGEVFDGS